MPQRVVAISLMPQCVVAISLMPQRIVIIFSAQCAFLIFELNMYTVCLNQQIYCYASLYQCPFMPKMD